MKSRNELAACWECAALDNLDGPGAPGVAAATVAQATSLPA
eukprot:CAMPEP_0182797868 /NCGR_PEP_ID=MMETSP0006_2-20121128/1049_1 /TAXON_ID=97485 /ORGANISM="Prymnesium parvum, Strain Texoma1" /LENGTH=40 /DNA_ID= /DNA_START= /DNA_END= /DNA_ORIENTATION=